MAKKTPQPTLAPRERAFLVGVELRDKKQILALDDSLAELALLADTAGVDVVGELTQRLDRPHVVTYIGPGKVEELKALADALGADGIIFGTVSGYDPYTPAITISIGLFARGERMGEYVDAPSMSTRM